MPSKKSPGCLAARSSAFPSVRLQELTTLPCVSMALLPKNGPSASPPQAPNPFPCDFLFLLWNPTQVSPPLGSLPWYSSPIWPGLLLFFLSTGVPLTRLYFCTYPPARQSFADMPISTSRSYKLLELLFTLSILTFNNCKPDLLPVTLQLYCKQALKFTNNASSTS